MYAVFKDKFGRFIYFSYVCVLSKEKNLSKKIIGQVVNNKALQRVLKQKIIKNKGQSFIFEFQGRRLEIKELKK